MKYVSFVTLLLSFVTVSMWAFQKWPQHPAVWLIMAAYVVFGAGNVFGAAMISYFGAVLFGPTLSTSMRRVRRFRPMSGSPLPFMQKWYGIVGFTILAQSLLLEIRWLSISVLLLGTVAFHGARFVQPPFIVYLGVTTNQSRNLANIIEVASRPFQATNLLYIRENRGLSDAMTNAISMRQVHEWLPWITVVAELMDVAKLIVLDIRMVSEDLDEEIAIITKADAWYKTIIIEPPASSAPDGLSNKVAELRKTSSGRSLVVDESAIVPLIRQIKRSLRQLPTRDAPIASFR